MGGADESSWMVVAQRRASGIGWISTWGWIMVKIITVHGTFASDDDDEGEKWWQVGSEFSDKLEEMLEASGDDIEIVPFHWNGDNSEKQRLKAGRKLYKLLRALDRDGEHYSILAHSHGGNVAMAALRRSTRWNKRLEGLDRFVTVGAPFLSAAPLTTIGGVTRLFKSLLFSACIFLPFLILAPIYEDKDFPGVINENTFEYLVILFEAYILLAGLVIAFPFVARFYRAIRRFRAGFDSSEEQINHWYGKRWVGLYDEDDEAINALYAAEHSQEALTPPGVFGAPFGFALAVFFNIVVVLVLFVFAIFEWKDYAMDGGKQGAVISDNLATMLMIAATGGVAYFIFRLMVFPVTRFLMNLTASKVMAWLMDRSIWNIFQSRSHGHDVGPKLQASHAPDEFGHQYKPLPEPCRDDLRQRVAGQSEEAWTSVRQNLANFRTGDGTTSLSDSIASGLSSSNLIHTNYFTVDSVIEYIAAALKGRLVGQPRQAPLDGGPGPVGVSIDFRELKPSGARVVLEANWKRYAMNTLTTLLMVGFLGWHFYNLLTVNIVRNGEYPGTVLVTAAEVDGLESDIWVGRFELSTDEWLECVNQGECLPVADVALPEGRFKRFVAAGIHETHKVIESILRRECIRFGCRFGSELPVSLPIPLPIDVRYTNQNLEYVLSHYKEEYRVAGADGQFISLDLDHGMAGQVISRVDLVIDEMDGFLRQRDLLSTDLEDSEGAAKIYTPRCRSSWCAGFQVEDPTFWLGRSPEMEVDVHVSNSSRVLVLGGTDFVVAWDLRGYENPSDIVGSLAPDIRNEQLPACAANYEITFDETESSFKASCWLTDEAIIFRLVDGKAFSLPDVIGHDRMTFDSSGEYILYGSDGWWSRKALWQWSSSRGEYVEEDADVWQLFLVGMDNVKSGWRKGQFLLTRGYGWSWKGLSEPLYDFDAGLTTIQEKARKQPASELGAELKVNSLARVGSVPFDFSSWVFDITGSWSVTTHGVVRYLLRPHELGMIPIAPLPVDRLGTREAQEYLNWLNTIARKDDNNQCVYRFPTQGEWQAISRHTKPEISPHPRWLVNQPLPVGGERADSLGLHGLHAGVKERVVIADGNTRLIGPTWRGDSGDVSQGLGGLRIVIDAPVNDSAPCQPGSDIQKMPVSILMQLNAEGYEYDFSSAKLDTRGP